MPQDFYRELLHRLAQLRRKRERTDLLTGILYGLSGILGILLIAIGAEAIGTFGIPERTAIFWSSLILAAIVFFAFSGKAILRTIGALPRASDDDLARMVGEHYTDINDRLVNSLQLTRPLFARQEVAGVSPAFALAAFSSTYTTARNYDFNAIVDERPVRRALAFFLASAVIFFGSLFGASNTLLAASERLVNYNTFYQKPAPFTFSVTPRGATVLRGDTVAITIGTDGEQLQRIRLITREEGQREWSSIDLTSVQSDTGKAAKRSFYHRVTAARGIQYFAVARDIESERFEIKVLDRPIIRSLSVTVHPPSYTGEKPMKLPENMGDIQGLVGTRGEIALRASKALDSAVVIFSPSHGEMGEVDSLRTGHSRTARRVKLAVADSFAKGVMTFMESGSYHVDLFDRDQIVSDHPIEYTVVLTRDEAPQIALIEPDERSTLPSNLRLDMLAKIRDDYGFRSLKLGYRVSKSKYLPPEEDYRWIELPLADRLAQELDVPYIWNLTKLDLAPEDEVSFVLQVTDNDVVTGPKSVRTAEYTTRYPSVTEVFKKAEEEAAQAERSLKEINQDAAELKKQIDQAMDEMRQMKPSDIAKQQQDFAKQKDMQQILDRQKELSKRVEQVAKDLDKMTNELNKQQAISPETMEKYMELQKLFEEINSPELQKAMEKLQQAMQQVDPKKVQEAMKNMQINEEAFKKSIERTANILKKIQAEQKLDEMMKKTGELAKQEQKLADQQRESAQKGEKMTPQEKAAAERMQQDAQKELERIRKQAEDFAKDMQKLPENMQAPDETKQAMEALADPSIDKAMQDAAQSSQQGEQQRSSQRSQDAAQKMRNAQRKMGDLKRKMAQNEKQKNLQAMKEIGDDLNKLSKQEEKLKNDVQRAQQNSNVFRDLAQKQTETREQLGQTASKMMELAQKTTDVPPEMGKQMGEAFNKMQEAQQDMTERDQQGASQNAQQAMAALNQAAQGAQQAMNQMQQSGQGGQGGKGGEGEGEGEGGEQPGMSPGQGSAMQQFLNQINSLAAQQQALNDAAQGMAQGGSAQAQREMMQRQAQMERMTAQQKQIRKSLEEMAREQQEARDGKRIAGESLQKIIDDMADVTNKMREGGISDETIQRQERILSRLLQAQRSVHEREKEEQREGKAGENVVRQSPRDIDLTSQEGRRLIQEELQRARETGYTRDYNALIKKYFEQLEKAGKK